MTKLTTERLEEIAKLEITEFSNGMDIAKDAYQSVGSSEIVLMARQLLAYEQAAKKPIGSFHISGGQVEATTDYCRDGEWPVQDGEVLVYAAPVLPKQPVKPVMFIDGDISSDDAEELAAVIREFGNEPAPAQPVSEPKLPSGWKLVPIEPTAAMFHAFNDCDYGRKSMRERYIQMIEAAPAQESE